MTINRRKMLTSIGAATVAPLALSSKARAAVTGLRGNPLTESPSPAMLDALASFTTAVREFHEAREARDWIIAEWRHLWPLAPEELLAGAGAETRDIYDTAERDIAGRPLWRNTADLTKRLSAKQRRQDAQLCFHLTTADYCTKRLAYLQAYRSKGRTEKSLARDKQWRVERMQEWKTIRAKAEAYEAKTARIREASGIQAALYRVTAARDFAARAL